MFFKVLLSVDLSTVQKMGFPPVSISRLLRRLCYQRHKEPGSVVLCATPKTFISLNS